MNKDRIQNVLVEAEPLAAAGGAPEGGGGGGTEVEAEGSGGGGGGANDAFFSNSWYRRVALHSSAVGTVA